MQKTALDPIVGWFTQNGFSEVHLDAQGGLLSATLSSSDQNRLLADAELRQQLVAQARNVGFSRVALELSATP